MSDFTFQVVGDASQARAAVDGVTNRLDELNRRVAQSSKILNERLRDVGKGLAFNMAAQSFDKLKGSLDGVSGAALSAGASGAAMGATFAGPWGAAIGGAIGLTKGFVTGLLDEEKALKASKKALDDQAKAYWDGVRATERKQAVTALLADTTERLARAERERAEFEKAQAGARGAQASNVLRLQGTISGLQDRLQELEGRGGLTFATPGFDGGEGEKVEVRRKLRDAELELEAATKSYGAALLPIKQAENERKDRIEDLEQLLGSQTLSQEESKRALKELNTLYRAGSLTVDEYNKKLEERNRLEQEQQQRYRELLAHDLGSIGTGLGAGMFGEGVGARTAELKKSLEKLRDDFRKVGEDREKERKEAVEENRAVMEHSLEAQRKLADEAAEQAARVEEAWGQGLGSVAADFINMAAQGEMSFEKLGSKLAVLALQIAAMQIGGPWGAALGSFAGGLNLGGNRFGGDHLIQGRGLETFGLPRAQYGADWRIGGPPGPDKTLVAFWGSRDESVHVRTPAQRHQEQRAQRPAAGPVNVAVIAANNERDVITAGASYGAQRVFVENQRRYGRRTR